jgi:hypothetical protein
MILKKSFMTLAILILVFCLSSAAFAALIVTPTTPTAALSFQVGQNTRSQLLTNLNKNIQMEGYFVASSTPILVQNLELVRGGTPPAPDKYVPLVGTIPTSFKNGAKVRVTGLLQKPTGENLQNENLALQISAGAQASILQNQPSVMATPNVLTSIPNIPMTPVAGNRYALLIGGGATGTNNYVRFWNDLWVMYHILLARGYSPANIRVAYAAGIPYPGGSGLPINYQANIAGINAAFSYFVPRVQANDSMLVFVSGMSGPPGSAGPTPVLWGWGWQPISPMGFATQVNRIANYREMTIHLSSAFGGAFIPSLIRPKRIIITAASATKDAYCDPTYTFTNFNLWYMSALVGHHLIYSTAMSADTNGNGKISKTEAYNFTLPRPGLIPISAQQPQYEDNGALPSRWGPVPSGTEGAVGANSYY